MTERPKSNVEVIGDRCLEVVRSHKDDEVPGLRLIAEFAWALGIQIDFSLEPVSEDQSANPGA